MRHDRGQAGALKRWYIDLVYGSPNEWWWRGWVALLVGGWLLVTLFLLGMLVTTPAKRLTLSIESYVERCAVDAGVDPATNVAWNESLPCDDQDSATLEQAAGSAVNSWIAYLEDRREDGPPADSEDLERDNAFFAAWIDTNICSRDNTVSERKARAWLMHQHTVCSGLTRWTAMMPLDIWWGSVGVVLTLLVTLGLGAAVVAFVWRVVTTREAYRMLYGTNHRRR